MSILPAESYPFEGCALDPYKTVALYFIPHYYLNP